MKRCDKGLFFGENKGCNGLLVQHHSAGLSQTKNTLNSVSQDDFTTTKLAPDNNTKAPDPPNDVEETKQGVINVVDILSEKIVDSNKTHGNHSKTMWP